MPVFDENDEEELRRMSSGENDWELPDFSDNLPRKKKPPTKPVAPISPPKSNQIKLPPSTPNIKSNQAGTTALPRVKSSIPSPNLNWRSALNNNNNAVSRSVEDPSKKTKVPVYAEQNDFTFMDLGYDDFERAMFEVEMGGINPGGSTKRSEIPIEHEGMKSGEVLKSSAWQALVNSEGEQIDLSKVHKSSDVLVLYADPRRSNDEYRVILNEFRKIPVTNLKISLVAVNCDESNDLRKFLKKNSYPFPLYTDPKKSFMDATKCRAKKRLSASLMVIEISSGRVLKVWYEGAWDPVTTKDLISEEIIEYRTDPIAYVQSQIGIR